LTWQLVELPLPVSVHVGLVNVPPLLADQVTLPVGLVWLPTSVSVTVAVQVVVLPAFRLLGAHATLAVVARLMMLSVAVSALELGALLGLKFAPPL
jgi:hypothetical protein